MKKYQVPICWVKLRQTFYERMLETGAKILRFYC